MTAPMTAAEARQLADRLEASETALSKVQRAARKVAEFDAWQDSFNDEGAGTDTVTAARVVWEAAAADPSVGLPELFTVWAQFRQASALRSRLVSEANAAMSTIRPKRHPRTNIQMAYRPDTHDPLEGLAFVPTIDAVLSARLAAASDAAVSAVRTRVTKAGEVAAQAAQVAAPK